MYKAVEDKDIEKRSAVKYKIQFKNKHILIQGLRKRSIFTLFIIKKLTLFNKRFCFDRSI